MKKVLFGLVFVVTGVQAEVRYDVNNPSHKRDLECVAALSIARDQSFNVDNQALRRYTQKQNEYILKYDRIPTLHIDTRKILIKNDGTYATILKRCV